MSNIKEALHKHLAEKYKEGAKAPKGKHPGQMLKEAMAGSDHDAIANAVNACVNHEDAEEKE